MYTTLLLSTILYRYMEVLLPADRLSRGFKQPGWCHESERDGAETYLQTKTVWVQV